MTAKECLTAQLRKACEEYGFFQLTGHGIPEDLLEAALQKNEEFFNLPMEMKEKYDKSRNDF